MKDLLEAAARNLVTKPEEVQITETIDDTGIVLELRVANEDVGGVIGKEGETARSIRIILNALAAHKSMQQEVLFIVE